MANKNIKKFYQHSNKQYYYLPHAIGHGAPITIPEDAGLMYIDIDSGNAYVSTAKSQTSDWKMITGGSGGSIIVSTNGVNNPEQGLLNLQEGTGITLTDDGLGTVTIESSNAINTKSVVNLTTDRTISLSSSWTDFSNSLEIPVEFGKIYSFRMFCIYDIDNTNYGTKWAVNSNANALGLGYYSYNSPALGVQTSFFYNTANTTFNEPTNAAGTTSMASSNIAIIEGFFQPDTTDFLFPSVANDGGGGTAGLTLRKGSYIEYTAITA